MAYTIGMSRIFTFILMIGAVLLVFPAIHASAVIEMQNGYFWNAETETYWVPHGFAYQTINPPVFATQTPEQIDYDFLEMRKMHADSLRVDFTWGYIEKTNDIYDWSATDHIIATAEKYGLRLFVLIGYQYPPGWFSDDWKAVNSSNETSNIVNYEHPLAQAAYTDFIAHVTGRYKDSPAVAGWILGNEYAYFDLWEQTDPHLFVGYDTNYSLPSFKNYLTNVYDSSIAALNTNWGTAYASFNDVMMPTNYPGVESPGNVSLQNRNLPAYFDLIQWRKQSIGNFVALGAVAAQTADTNHLCSYSMVGGIYSGFDANNTCEDAKTIVARCEAAGAPLDFWAINNYAWASQGNELRSAQFGITKYQDQSGLPVLVTETGHSSTENLFPGASTRQAIALPGQVWEALMAGAVGVHIFTWNDRPFSGSQIREAGFGIVQTNRLTKGDVYWNILETFRRMEQVDIGQLLGGTENPAYDIHFYWSSDADMVWPRANQENTMLWGGLKRLGYEPGFIDEDDLDSGSYTSAPAMLLSHAFMMNSNRLSALTNVIASGVNLHANATLPGRYDPYHKENSGWTQIISDIFGLTVNTATNFWHGGIAGNWDQPYTKITVDYLTTLGPLNPSYTFTNYASWVRQANITANSGTTIVNVAYDYYAWRTLPGLQIKGHGTQGRAAINTWTLGDTLKMWWLTNAPPAPEIPEELAWQLHYDWNRAIYRDWFGMMPSIDITGSGYFYVMPDYRICTNGSVLISLLNESTNAVTIGVNASNLIQGLTVEKLSSASGILESPSDGRLDLTLAGDEYVLLYAYTNNESLVNSNQYKIWQASEPLGVWPDGRTRDIEIGYDTRGTSLDLYLALELKDSPHTVYGQTNVTGISGIGTNTLHLPVRDADMNDSAYISSHDGTSYVFHAWLQNGGTMVSDCYLDTRLLWGAKPTSLPATVQTGQTYDVTVLWQELPSYLSREYPTPLNRADAWETAQSNAEMYTVYLELMTGDVVVASDYYVTSTGTESNDFEWRARTVNGNLSPPTSNNHDVVDSFEDRERGEGADYIAPWTAFSYDQYDQIVLWSTGVNSNSFEGTNGAFLVVNSPNPGGWSGFGMAYEYAETWALPHPSETSSKPICNSAR